MNGIPILVGICAISTCGECGQTRVGRVGDAGKSKMPGFCDKSFELTVQPDNGNTIMYFRYPDLRGRVALVYEISIDKIEQAEAKTFCEIRIVDLKGPRIASSWVLGTVPSNFRGKGCYEANFSPGDYEVIISSDRFETRRRLHVEPEGRVDVLSWEERTRVEPCERKRGL
jgi:hypothetical protein